MRTRQQAPSRRGEAGTVGSVSGDVVHRRDVGNSYRFACKACGAHREVFLDCDPSNAELYGSFIRCPACLKTDRGNSALYWGFFGLKVLAMSALMSVVAIATTPYLFVLVPLGLVALWADHLRFFRKLDLAMIGATVTGGPARERLQRR